MEVCERLIGKPEKIAVAAGFASKQAPFAWRNGSKDRDPGDIPSARTMRALLAWSDARQLGLTAEHLVRGADPSEIDAILAARDTVASFSTHRDGVAAE